MTGTITTVSGNCNAGSDVVQWSSRVIGRRPSRLSKTVLQQSEMDCGAACVGTISRQYGRTFEPNRLRELTNGSVYGATMLGLKSAAETLGFECHAYRHSMAVLASNHLPAIINWRGYHWAVVRSVRKGKIRMSDPALGNVTLTERELTTGWSGYVLYLRPTSSFLEQTSDAATLWRFIPQLRSYAGAIGHIVVAALCIQFLQLLSPLLTKFIIDSVVLKRDGHWLWPAAAAATTVLAVSIGAGLLRQRLLTYVSYGLSFKLTSAFWNRLLILPLSFFYTRRTGDITSRMEECGVMGDFFASRGPEGLLDAAGIIMCLLPMLYISPALTGVSLVAVSLHLVNLRLISPLIRQGFRIHSQRAAETANHLVESMAGLRTIKVLAIERRVRATYENLLAREANANFASLRYRIGGDLCQTAIGQFGALAILFAGASAVLDGGLSIGSMVAFAVLMRQLFGPVGTLAGYWDDLQRLIASSERLADVAFSAPETGSSLSDETFELPTLTGRISFDNVSFRYGPDLRDVLQNVSLEIEAGQTVAFVGRSGSGKSTLIKLLLGFCRPMRGTITVDGFDLTRVWLPSLRRQIGLIPQDAHIFADSVHANIALDNPTAPFSQVVRAAKQTGVHNFICSLPQGYETQLAERGANLSGGQRQRIALARAFLRNPPILILDESSAALDSESEALILSNIREHFYGRTVLMVAHRLTTVRHADLIVVFDRGHIVEQGTHDQLIARRGLYFLLLTQNLQH